jgi:formylglycine-generating enzyme required for sulfatase activity
MYLEKKMKKYLILLAAIILAACSSQENQAPTDAPIPTSTLVPSDTPQPTNTVVLPTATSTRAPTSTPAHDPGTIMINPSDGASMAYIPPGEFMMGNDSGEEDEQPAHLVYTEGFWMYQYEVTNAQYSQCITAGVCEELFMASVSMSSGANKSNEWIITGQYPDHPVMFASPGDARDYCGWVGARLPTEAEWERAARGGLEGMKYPWGNQDPVCTPGAENGVWFGGCGGNESDNPTAPVGSFAPNGYGLYDMAGNVWEWVNDRYDEDYYDLEVYDNPQGPTGGQGNSLRGCCFSCSSTPLRITNRQWGGGRYHHYGFRCAVSP